VRTLGVVALVLLILLLALPMGVGMAVAPCQHPHLPFCVASVGACLAILGFLMLLLPALSIVARTGSLRPPLLLFAPPLERPPRLSRCFCM